ncbi:hypothetical protein BHE74_00058622 [Ensete ventricosum]|nr:hypothetical protein BHE74_00058622 [Ensete ventricosum]
MISSFKVGGTPSNNKGWNSRFFFVSTFKGWGFSVKWIGHDMDANGHFILCKNEPQGDEVVVCKASSAPQAFPIAYAPVVQASSTDEIERPSKKTKVLISKAPSNTNPSLPAMIAPRKETPTAAAPRKVAPPKVPREEVSNRHLDKVVS